MRLFRKQSNKPLSMTVFLDDIEYLVYYYDNPPEEDVNEPGGVEIDAVCLKGDFVEWDDRENDILEQIEMNRGPYG